MSNPTRTLYRLEVRPLTLSPWRKVTIWNSKTQQYDTYSLKRGNWYTAHLRVSDDRAVFAGGPGSSRLNSLEWVTKRARELKRRGFATRLVSVKVPLYPHLRGDLDANENVLRAANETAKDLGVTIDVISGKRTLAEQQFLYDLYLAGKGNLAAKPNANAPHVRGIAIDAYVKGVPLRRVKGAEAAAKKHGLIFPVPSEAWHASVGT